MENSPGFFFSSYGLLCNYRPYAPFEKHRRLCINLDAYGIAPNLEQYANIACHSEQMKQTTHREIYIF